MTGMYTGAKNNSSLKPSIKSDSIQTEKSTTSGTSMKSAEKISYRKMSNGIAKLLRNKANPNKPHNTTSFPSPTIYPASTPSS